MKYTNEWVETSDLMLKAIESGVNMEYRQLVVSVELREALDKWQEAHRRNERVNETTFGVIRSYSERVIASSDLQHFSKLLSEAWTHYRFNEDQDWSK